MTFLFINTQERAALMGLPYIQQLAYLVAIRPYMDRKTHIVGIKRKISYQSLAEELYIEPHQGYRGGSPTRPQLRRVIKGLQRAGLVEIQSDDKSLILKCLVADGNYSVPEKAVTNPSPEAVTKASSKNPYKSAEYDNSNQKSVMGKSEKGVIPHNSENNLFFYLREKFEKFWNLYPRKADQTGAFEVFARINPDDALFTQMLSALKAQVQNREQLELIGEFVPYWKNPANWLSRQCWKDELIPVTTKEHNHATHQHRSGRKSAADLISESCQGADFDFNFEDEQPAQTSRNENIVPIGQGRNQ
ncbi:hypothetical protein E3983_10065 [Legionella israelensis]|uniref:Protein LvrA n=1 Tax=Legionella israelensis TaxID=454 RepID=A0AAX1EHW8_9GAMM|nr:hypothetical protein [Legionella israelensis]QBR84678.1 hypothetical protein E3983_10065 [Legionella israelensis]